ncbi:hypothetical protein J3R83DRAFT_6482 [Lanmaoa asiatica]|nr:hypothetical protein J3R83DRAFT_6482 [Lanmaoa asiatica]
MFVVPKASRAKLIHISSVAVGGAAGSIVTSVGGPAITLAASSAGIVNSFAGSEYTAIASSTRSEIALIIEDKARSIFSTANAVVNVHSVTVNASPMLTALVTVVGGTLLLG